MATLPLTINGQIVDLNQLTGFNYVTGYPEIAALLQQAGQSPNFGWTAANMFIYPIPGRQTIYAIPGRSWGPGQRLRAYAFGNASDYRTIYVYSYDIYSGKLVIEVVASSSYVTPASANTGYYLTPNYSEPAFAGAIPIANGGTGAFTLDTARTSLQLPSRSTYSILFHDFILPDTIIRNRYGEDLSSDGYTPIPLEAAYSAHPGLYHLPSDSGNDAVAFGRIASGWTDFSGDSTYFEASVYIKALSTSLARYELQVGLIGTGVGNYAGLYASYTDNINGGQFVFKNGLNGAVGSTNTTVAVAASTWYKIQLAISSGNIYLTINGTNAASTAKASYQGMTQSNWMTPAVVNTAAASNKMVVDYLYFIKHLASGR